MDVRPTRNAPAAGHVEFPVAWNISLATLTAIALFAALYVARAVVLPIVLALLFSFLLSPVVRFLGRLRVPAPLAAGIVIIALFSLAALALLLLYEPAAQWISRLPHAISRLQVRLEDVLEAVRKMREATEQLDRIGTELGQRTASAGAGLQGMILSLTWQFLAGTVLMMFLLFFLLGSGDLLLRKFVRVLPRMRHKRMAVVVARHIEHDVSAYLFTVAFINTVLGLVVGTIMYLMDMPNPVLWGVMAGLLNFIPYLGPAVTLTILSAVAILSFDSLKEAMLRPATFLVVTTLEGQLITPLILGRRLMLNPIIIFVSLIFWGWMWGIIGALVAVPLTMIIRILCGAIPPLRPLGELLSR